MGKRRESREECLGLETGYLTIVDEHTHHVGSESPRSKTCEGSSMVD
jgi:hypothetical protein